MLVLSTRHAFDTDEIRNAKIQPSVCEIDDGTCQVYSELRVWLKGQETPVTIVGQEADDMWRQIRIAATRAGVYAAEPAAEPESL